MKKTNKKSPPKKRMADGLLQGLKEAVLIHQGKLEGRRTTLTLPKPAPTWSKNEIKKLRESFEMSQMLFAHLLNVKVATVRSWEQGHRTPDGATSRLLQIFADDIEGIKLKYAS